mmetsp:Transcript_2107/g.4803  ORF Transcript_2107/g.4803 Transcript_2107/m.4803 type:complete len:307 (-) Transcript_2107:201-1121(-)
MVVDTLRTCVLSSSELARSIALDEHPELHRVASAVRELQRQGFQVILVSGSDLDGVRACIGEDAAIDRRRVFHVDAKSDHDVGLLRVAEEYECHYVTNVDCISVAKAQALSDQQRTWIQSVGRSLQMRYSFGPEGRFAVWLPMAIPEVRVLRTERGQRTEYLLCVHCADASDGLFRSAAGLLIELACGDGDRPMACEKDPTLKAALKACGGIWASEPWQLLCLGSGSAAGLRAVGVGSNLQKRGRAAQLALAATVALHCQGPELAANPEQKAWSALLLEARSQAERLLASNGQASIARERTAEATG